jgi:prolyl-tRNA synthetase
MALNETKLLNAVGAKAARPASEDEIRAAGAAPGYASPVGLRDVLVVVDDLIPRAPNLVAGANETGFHLRHVNYGRDYSADIIADIAAADAGDGCPSCGRPLRAVRGVETGNIFKLGTHFSEALDATFDTEDGERRPVVMGSYGIGLGRMLACIAEEYNDEYGLCWPVTVAPYSVHIVQMRGCEAVAEELYDDLRQAGIDVLLDDRDERPGVKFNDADLIGVPLRLTVGKRALNQGGVELKLRTEAERELVLLDDVAPTVKKRLDELAAALTPDA